MVSQNASSPRQFLPLKGTRVLSFEVAYSLPAGTRTLAELGAEVVRVAGPGRDSYYISVVDGVYMSKPCIGINLKDPEGLAIAKQLAAKADVICSNFVPGVMERLGLGADELRAINPSAIVLQLSGYGTPGPWSNYAAFGPSTEAAGGMNQLVGSPDGPPVRLGSGVFSDQLAGRFAAIGLIAALKERQRTGKGRYLDVSMSEAITLLVGNTVVGAALGDPPLRLWNRDRDFAPQGIYPATGDDEWIAITVKDDRQWQALLRVVSQESEENPALEDLAHRLKSEDFGRVSARHINHSPIDHLLAEWTAGHDKHALAERLQAAGVAAHAVVRSRDPLFDEHLKQRGLFQSVAHETPILGYAAHPHPTTPWFADGHERHQLRNLHFHGADNVSVLREWLGMDAEQVASLEESGALIVRRDIKVEDRRTAYRDADHAEQLALASEVDASTEIAALSRDAGVGRGAGGEGELPLSQTWERGPGGEGEGLRILELSQGPAGGFAGLMLAQLGHEVVRVELPGRYAGVPTAVLDEAEQAFLHRRKKSVELDETTWGSQFLTLASQFDAVVEDLGPGALGGLGITVHRLRDLNRNLAVASISPFGQDGPKAQWEASELIIQASAGVLHSTGWQDEPPSKAGGFSAHHIAGLNAATAILARCYGIRAGNCGGGRIDVSMQETYIHHWTRHIGEWAYTGTRMKRELPGFGHQGFRHTAMTSDGYLYVLSLYASWEEIALFFGLEDFVTGEWSNAAYRMEHWPELEQPYLEIVASKPRYQWFAEAAAAGFTFAPVHTAADQFVNPQYAARGFLKPAELDGETIPVPGLPFAWDEPAMPNRPPEPGEHNAEFLGQGVAP
ncbi:MAG: CoA transferase [Dehalococcoidia bacterium]